MAAPYIIAEIASAHEGDPKHCSRLIALAATTGADAIKLQMFRRDALLSRFHAKFDSFGQIELAPAAWRSLLIETRATGRDVIVEPFDEQSLEDAEASGVVTAYKLPTSDIGNLDFVRRAARTGKRVYLGVGGATADEITAAIEAIYPKVSRDVVLMHGFQAFPTKLEDSNIARIARLHEEFGLAMGYADHVDAEDGDMAKSLPLMAIAAGATVIEKHITDDRSRKGRDHYSSLNPDEFKNFVALLRRAAVVMGSADPALTPAEVDYRNLMKKQAVAAAALPAGSSLQPDRVAYKRTGLAGLGPSKVAELAGRRLKAAKVADQPIAGDDLE